jgi:hypothetical protein
MHKLTYEDVEQAHIDRLKDLGYTDEEIPGILEAENDLGFLMEDSIAMDPEGAYEEPIPEPFYTAGGPGMKPIELRFGVLCAPLKEQLEGQGVALAPSQLTKYERVRSSINYLRIHRYITDSASDRAFRKLMQSISKDATKTRIIANEKEE